MLITTLRKRTCSLRQAEQLVLQQWRTKSWLRSLMPSTSLQQKPGNDEPLQSLEVMGEGPADIELYHEISSLEEPFDDPYGYIQNRGVPFIYLPHAVKKAYQLHLSPLRTPKAWPKYCWVTKTISTPGLPEHYNTIPDEIGGKRYVELLQEYRDSLLHTVAYTKLPRNRSKMMHVPDRINYSMMMDLLRLVSSEPQGAEHLSPSNSYLFHTPLLETHWFRNYKFYYTKHRPNFVLRTRDGLEMVEEPVVVSDSQLAAVPGPYDTYSMNTYRQDIVHLRNRPAMDNFNENPLKHAHTTIVVENRLQKEEHFRTTGLLTTFSQAASQAGALGSLHGMELAHPIVTQCVVTNGPCAMFFVFQLNTLDMSGEHGVWNRVWHTPLTQVYPRRRRSVYSQGFMVFEDVEREGVEKGIGDEFFRLMLNFFRMNTLGTS